MQRVLLCVYSQFAHWVCSCRAAIVLLALARLINFLFLRVDARVTFPAGAHTLLLSTASHPGYKNKGSSLGGLLHGKEKSTSIVTHSTLHMKPDKGNVNELRG